MNEEKNLSAYPQYDFGRRAGQAGKRWKKWLLKFLLYLAVGFLCAFLYNQFKK